VDADSGNCIDADPADLAERGVAWATIECDDVIEMCFLYLAPRHASLPWGCFPESQDAALTYGAGRHHFLFRGIREIRVEAVRSSQFAGCITAGSRSDSPWWRCQF